VIIMEGDDLRCEGRIWPSAVADGDVRGICDALLASSDVLVREV
jgi:hypothetical protein